LSHAGNLVTGQQNTHLIFNMQLDIIKKYAHTPFSVVLSQVQNRPGTWNSTKVSIFRDDKLTGEYLRNYSSFGSQTFYPFQVNNEWYALYSASYTATRVMKLHDDRIEDWCGENESAHGFCPTEIYIPQYVHSKHTMNIQGKDDTYDSYYVDCDSEPEEFKSEIESDDFVSLQYCNFGFLCGCVWGDDTSWKLRYVDLSKIPEKILTITEKFGYWELPSLPLQKCIRMDGWEPGHDWVVLMKEEHINLATGERD
jgi:hypothetical protein